MIAQALESLRPGARWTLIGDAYAGINWLDAVQTKPTEAQVNVEITNLQTEASAEASRVNSIRTDSGRIDLLNRLKTATPAQIDSWIDTNVTNIASARTVLKAIVKAIALDART